MISIKQCVNEVRIDTNGKTTNLSKREHVPIENKNENLDTN